MNFTPSEQHERAAAFEQIKAKGNHVLGDLRVMRGLGHLTVELLAAWNSAFLPNVRHGVVKLPPQMRFTNAFSLLPLNDQELHGELRIDPSMYEPTLQRRDVFVAAGGTRTELNQKTAECVDKWGSRSPRLWRNKPAETFTAQFPRPDTFFTTRPIIYMSGWLAEKGAVTVGRLGIHETTHALQSERDTEEQFLIAESDPAQGQLYLADCELEAYQTGAVVLEIAGLDPVNSGLLDFEVAALAGIQDQRERFAREMAALSVIPTVAQLAAQA